MEKRLHPLPVVLTRLKPNKVFILLIFTFYPFFPSIRVPSPSLEQQSKWTGNFIKLWGIILTLYYYSI